MLVLSRKVGERILIGDQIAVTIVRVTGGGVRVGIEAPPEMAVLRAEILNENAPESVVNSVSEMESPTDSAANGNFSKPQPSAESARNGTLVRHSDARSEYPLPAGDENPIRKPR